MFKIIIFACFMAFAMAKPLELVSSPVNYLNPLTYSSPLTYNSPLIYNSPLTYAAPYGYNAFPYRNEYKPLTYIY